MCVFKIKMTIIIIKIIIPRISQIKINVFSLIFFASLNSFRTINVLTVISFTTKSKLFREVKMKRFDHRIKSLLLANY